jgi:hypothetical protein
MTFDHEQKKYLLQCYNTIQSDKKLSLRKNLVQLYKQNYPNSAVTYDSLYNHIKKAKVITTPITSDSNPSPGQFQI